MPNLFDWRGYRFFFFSNEGNPLEPCHVHIRKGEATAKFWLVPEIRLAKAYAMSSQELKQLEDVVFQNSEKIREKWNEYFGI
jgi:hypothetical protein